MTQISIIPMLGETEEELKEIAQQAKKLQQYAKQKRSWENAFQKWSDENGMSDGTESYGCCGYGSMCDWCKDNSYGRPCIRALNAMCREKNIQIDYTSRDFEMVWSM